MELGLEGEDGIAAAWSWGVWVLMMRVLMMVNWIGEDGFSVGEKGGEGWCWRGGVEGVEW